MFARSLATLGLSMMVALVGHLLTTPAQVGAQVSGNAYSSPAFGYSVTWDSAGWYVVEEGTEDGQDHLVLSNGQSVVIFTGSASFGGDARQCVGAMTVFLNRDPTVSNVQPLTDASGAAVSGGDSAKAYVGSTYTLTFDDGSSVDLARYSECRAIVPGSSVLVISHLTPIWAYESEAPLVAALLTGVVIPSAGEDGPVSMSGPWRIAVAGGVQDEEIAAAGLQAKEGKQWLFLVADVTNTSGEPATLDLTDFKAGASDGSTPASLAAKSSASVARRLTIDQGDGEPGLAFGPDETKRTVLVFQLHGRGGDASLMHKGSSLPLDRVVSDPIDLGALPPMVTPPHLVEATVEEVIDGRTLSVVLPGESEARLVSLFGIDAPTGGECFAGKSASKLRGLTRGTVLLEQDRVDRIDGALARYVWVRKDDGSLSMVNRTMLVGGYGRFDDGGGGQRFGDWLRQGGDAARAKAAGLWESCEGLTAEPADTASPTAPPDTVDDASWIREGIYRGSTTELRRGHTERVPSGLPSMFRGLSDR